MSSLMRHSILSLLAATTCCLASDWPMYKYDTDRSSVTGADLKLPLTVAWHHSAGGRPQPAWPDPPRLYNKMDFDFAPHPVIAEGIVCFASTADDSVRAVDPVTGELKWIFTAGGPVRLPPQIYDGKVYFGADDGCVYCLEKESGQLTWKFNAAPHPEMYIGNGRMISRWPVRTGVIVEDGVLYTVAGMWPSEGIYVYALDAKTGEQVWRNDTSSLAGNKPSGTWRPNDPHTGEFSYTGPTPQGALVTSKDTLIVPLGNNAPAAYSKQTGGLIRFSGKSTGSSWLTKDGDMVYYLLLFRSGLELFGSRVADKGLRNRATRFTRDKISQYSPAPRRRGDVKHGDAKTAFIVRSGKLYAERGYGMAMIGRKLVVGGKDTIRILDAETREELWSSGINGEAREIAYSNGRLYVGLSTGTVTCFENSTPRQIVKRWNPIDVTKISKPVTDVAAVVSALGAQQISSGFALVVGDSDRRFVEHLARNTRLKIVSISSDKEAIVRDRTHLVRQSFYYGSRVHLLHVPDMAKLPFSKFFADSVIVAGEDPKLSGTELFRVLRPYGGVWMNPGLSPAAATELISQVDTEANPTTGTQMLQRAGLIRGALKGARNWDTNQQADQRVKWPLRPIWFGGPAASLVMNVGIGSHPPVASNGRYFVTGQDSMSAVNAYNGEVIWTRAIPSATPDSRTIDGLHYKIRDGLVSTTVAQWTDLKRWLSTDGQHVYLRLGKNHFRAQSEALIQMDARTGRIKKTFGPVVESETHRLDEPLQWEANIDEHRQGSLRLSHTPESIVVSLATKDPTPAAGDSWQLFFDFRSRNRRCGLYEKGTFEILVQILGEGGRPGATVVRDRSLSLVRSTFKVDENEWTADIALSKSELSKLSGRSPTSFGFAATFNSHDGPTTSVKKSRSGDLTFAESFIEQRHLFGDVMAPWLNVGWANIMLKTSDEGPVDVVAGALEERPENWPWPDMHRDVYIGHPGTIASELRSTPRKHPLTGEPSHRTFRSGAAGYGNPVYSATSIMGRTSKQALGFYDLEEDSGLRFFPGIATNCGARIKAINMTAALGLLIFSDSRSHCSCMVPIRTSMAFAPAERRLEEDWAIFFERDLDAPLRHARLNLGSFGDRRDDNSHLWVRVPRYASGRSYPIDPGTRRWVIDAPPMQSTMDVPLTIVRDMKTKSGPYRASADGTNIEGTTNPWIYTSGYLSAKSMRLELYPVSPMAATAIGAVAIDGALNEITAEMEPEAYLKYTRTKVHLRYHPEFLYVAANRAPIVGRRGAKVSWAAKATEESEEVFKDDCFEIFISSGTSRNFVHLAVSASGTAYDAVTRNGIADAGWNGTWDRAAVADDDGFRVELKIPWNTLAGHGIDRESLTVNLQSVQQDISKDSPYWAGSTGRVLERSPGISESLVSLGPDGRKRCKHFVNVGLGKKPSAPERTFTVRLHFADLKDNPSGHRVFDVGLQGETVLKDFDIVSEAGGPRRALVKEFRNVNARSSIELTFTPPKPRPLADQGPIISGIEVLDEAK